MTFTTTANIECTTEQWSQIFYETHIAYRLALIHSICSSTIQWTSKLPTQTHQLHYLSSRTCFSDSM